MIGSFIDKRRKFAVIMTSYHFHNSIRSDLIDLKEALRASVSHITKSTFDDSTSNTLADKIKSLDLFHTSKPGPGEFRSSKSNTVLYDENQYECIKGNCGAHDIGNNSINDKDIQKRRMLLKKVIALMPTGVDTSILYPEMVMCCATNDIVCKKMVYLYLQNVQCYYAPIDNELARDRRANITTRIEIVKQKKTLVRSKFAGSQDYNYGSTINVNSKEASSLAILAINTLVKEAQDEMSPIVRALALRTLSYMRIFSDNMNNIITNTSTATTVKGGCAALDSINGGGSGGGDLKGESAKEANYKLIVDNSQLLIHQQKEQQREIIVNYLAPCISKALTDNSGIVRRVAILAFARLYKMTLAINHSSVVEAMNKEDAEGGGHVFITGSTTIISEILAQAGLGLPIVGRSRSFYNFRLKQYIQGTSTICAIMLTENYIKESVFRGINIKGVLLGFLMDTDPFVVMNAFVVLQEMAIMYNNALSSCAALLNKLEKEKMELTATEHNIAVDSISMAPQMTSLNTADALNVSHSFILPNAVGLNNSNPASVKATPKMDILNDLFGPSATSSPPPLPITEKNLADDNNSTISAPSTQGKQGSIGGGVVVGKSRHCAMSVVSTASDTEVMYEKVHTLILYLTRNIPRVTKHVFFHLLNRLRDFNEWQQPYILSLILRYEPANDQERFDIMNLLEETIIRSNNAALIHSVTHIFLYLTQNMNILHKQTLERLVNPLLTILSSTTTSSGGVADTSTADVAQVSRLSTNSLPIQSGSESAFIVLCHIKLLCSRDANVFMPYHKAFYFKVNDKIYIKMVKLDILTIIACCNTDSTTRDTRSDDPVNAPVGPATRNNPVWPDIVNELSVYISDINRNVSMEAIRRLCTIAFKVEAAAPAVLQIYMNFPVAFLTKSYSRKNALNSIDNDYDDVSSELMVDGYKHIRDTILTCTITFLRRFRSNFGNNKSLQILEAMTKKDCLLPDLKQKIINAGVFSDFDLVDFGPFLKCVRTGLCTFIKGSGGEDGGWGGSWTVDNEVVSKVSLLWAVGEFGEYIKDAPGLLEWMGTGSSGDALVEGTEEAYSLNADLMVDFAHVNTSFFTCEHPAVRIEILTAMLKIFFKRPAEMLPVIARIFYIAINDLSDAEVHNKALFYYRLLKNNPELCHQTIFSAETHGGDARLGGITVSPNFIPYASKCTEADVDENLCCKDFPIISDKLFEEFNTVSVVYGAPSSMYMAKKNKPSVFYEAMLKAEEEKETEEEDEVEDSLESAFEQIRKRDTQMRDDELNNDNFNCAVESAFLGDGDRSLMTESVTDREEGKEQWKSMTMPTTDIVAKGRETISEGILDSDNANQGIHIDPQQLMIPNTNTFNQLTLNPDADIEPQDFQDNWKKLCQPQNLQKVQFPAGNLAVGTSMDAIGEALEARFIFPLAQGNVGVSGAQMYLFAQTANEALLFLVKLNLESVGTSSGSLSAQVRSHAPTAQLNEFCFLLRQSLGAFVL